MDGVSPFDGWDWVGLVTGGQPCSRFTPVYGKLHVGLASVSDLPMQCTVDDTPRTLHLCSRF